MSWWRVGYAGDIAAQPTIRSDRPASRNHIKHHQPNNGHQPLPVDKPLLHMGDMAGVRIGPDLRCGG